MHTRPPFDATAARRLRESLGMTPGHVAYGMWAAFGLRISAERVTAWEHQEDAPTEDELAALAGALWCAPAELMGEPRTVREYRLARGTALTDVAMRVGMPAAQYREVERSGRWTGDERQAVALADALGMSLRARTELTGRRDRLVALLRSAAGSRWQGYVRPLRKLLPELSGERAEEVLELLNDEFHRRSFSSLSWIDTGSQTAQGSADAGRIFLDGIEEHFWAALDTGQRT
ncbi:helix-turn-helix transcriptional regulator [Streptomyces sp. 549]|uniref:helix-turn-helix transcriptional regulator n=1 Tax=Streptomyces sp. 549 TaxID=3049076 RepID=UPI0024C24720|nr:helix-turn-helix transcriptional regulator [Streptomyces sp. 549]MDK1474909.1 helix-turn-helix transcriptional regulator [Streptomyces sp. 549]